MKKELIIIGGIEQFPPVKGETALVVHESAVELDKFEFDKVFLIGCGERFDFAIADGKIHFRCAVAVCDSGEDSPWVPVTPGGVGAFDEGDTHIFRVAVPVQKGMGSPER